MTITLFANVNDIQKYVDNVLIAKEAGTDYMELHQASIWIYFKMNILTNSEKMEETS